MCVLADGDVGQQLPRRPRKGFKVPRISARVTSISDAEAVQSLADIKGLKIRVIENRPWSRAFSGWRRRRRCRTADLHGAGDRGRHGE